MDNSPERQSPATTEIASPNSPSEIDIHEAGQRPSPTQENQGTTTVNTADADVIIRARNLGKRYEMHRHRSMLLSDTVKMAFHRGYSKEFFWALQGVNFDIHRGQSVALVGPNGAGKSTLLSIIAKTTFPDRGTIDVRGRVSALLELGAGFHPHFTGRENIVINGIVMGLTRPEIEAKMDEIIAFSELGKFIDEPIQNYSSGMMARLGFSVAVSVDPEILIVDEALAVGDAAFQEKSFQRIMEFKEKSCTILFVTHALGMVEKFCDRAILLTNGQVLQQGEAKEICQVYSERLQAGTLVAPKSPYETEFLPLWKRVVALLVILMGCGVVLSGGIYFVLRNSDGIKEPNSVKRIKAMNEQASSTSTTATSPEKESTPSP